MTCVNVS